MKRIILLFLTGIAMAREIPLVAPIVITPEIKVKWNRSISEDVVTYQVKIRNQSDSINYFVVTTDTIVQFNASIMINYDIERIRITVQAIDRDSLYSVPSEPDSIQVSKVKRLYGDANCDGKVSAADAALFWRASGHVRGEPEYNAIFDINCDGKVGIIDHVALIVNIGQILE
jgi:hypothetical protein